MSETISTEAFQVLLDRAGISVSPANMEEMRSAYMMLQAMRERVRQPRGYDAEPAHIFAPAGR
ncbi:hypothetical protein [Bosea sp. (in: a-proteobacteria)]|uniref:hypothetical protein n=1 Tax=Bosea sp. (in: a-proteobacteria) TaxID=1871050 RepID=UPI002733A1A6|nr:hypothetical protein [Bosea sp. (in: a-proteobacteria)]MDP3408833.1 hypothetical protein [Bosea sp. (in: a-proteobacteria)]